MNEWQGCAIGMRKDRIVSVSEPEMRHGRKSCHQRFDGHKASLAVEAGSQLITAVAEGALDLVSESECNIGSGVCETVAAAYGDGETCRQFAKAERTLIAKVPKQPRSPYFTKQDFHIDLEAGRCTCPAGEVTTPPPPSGARPRRIREAGSAPGLCLRGCGL